MKSLSLFYFLCLFGHIFTTEINTYATSNHLFTSSIYKELAEKDGNILLCPVSAQIILSLALAGAGENTAYQLSEAIRLPQEPEKIQSIMSPLIQSLDSTKHVQLSSANKMFVDNALDVKPSFNDLARKTYGSDVQKLDFSNPTKSVDVINKWVESKTNNKIHDILDTSQVNQDTRLVLVNSLYFRGKWEYPFEPYETKIALFHITPERNIQVPMMGLNTELFYAESSELDARFLRLPYENDEVAMIIVLPNTIGGLKRLEARMEDVLKPQNYSLTKIYAQIPKFTTESKVEFVPIFEKWGYKDPFSYKANFRNISNSPLKISHIVQKAFIDINESGTEAAAATAGGFVLLSLPVPIVPKYKFVADHPFLYYLLHRETNTILFMGRLKNVH